MPSSKGSSQPGNGTCVSCGSFTVGGFFTAEQQGSPICTRMADSLCRMVLVETNIMLIERLGLTHVHYYI